MSTLVSAVRHGIHAQHLTAGRHVLLSHHFTTDHASRVVKAESWVCLGLEMCERVPRLAEVRARGEAEVAAHTICICSGLVVIVRQQEKPIWERC